MKKTQVSIRGETYEKLKKHCEKCKVSIAGFVVALCASFFAKGGDDARTAKAKKGNGNGKTKAKDVDTRKVTF